MKHLYTGRIGRLAYFVGSLYLALVLVVIGLIASLANDTKVLGPIVTIVYFLAFIVIFVVQVCQGIRRTHDIGVSGWLILLALVPFIGIFYSLVLLFMPASETAENYGAPYSRGLSPRDIFGR